MKQIEYNSIGGQVHGLINMAIGTLKTTVILWDWSMMAFFSMPDGQLQWSSEVEEYFNLGRQEELEKLWTCLI
jgi:hypothetical protein